MKFVKREVQYLGKRKLTKVDADNVPIPNEEPITVRIEKDEGEVYVKGTPINVDTLDKGNWRDDTSLSFAAMEGNTLPDAKEDETQFVTKSNGETWTVPPRGMGAAFKVTASSLVKVNGISQNEVTFTSDPQMQINSKEPKISLTPNRAVVTNGSGGLGVSATTSTQIGHLSGVTSNVQTQINALSTSITGVANDLSSNYQRRITDVNGKIPISNLHTGNGSGSVVTIGSQAQDNEFLFWDGTENKFRSKPLIIGRYLETYTYASNLPSTNVNNGDTAYVQNDDPSNPNNKKGMYAYGDSGWQWQYGDMDLTPYQLVSNIDTRIPANPSDSQYPSTKLFNSTKLSLENSINGKVSTSQGTENSRKVARVNASGNIAMEAAATSIASNDSIPLNSAVNSALATKANATDLTTHMNNKNNPHVVTKTQIGLGNVDNTSDINKPISTAQAAAIDAKQATITGAATTIASANLTASRVLVSDASGKVAASGVTSTQLGYVSGVSSAIQTQLNALTTNVSSKQPINYSAVPGSVAVATANTTWSAYGYTHRGQVAIPGVTATMVPIVIFDPSVMNRSYLVDSYNGGVYIYSTSSHTTKINKITVTQ